MIDVHCEQSPDGRHEVVWGPMSEPYSNEDDYVNMGYRCRHCKVWMGPRSKSVERLLNAAMCLTAEEAELIKHNISDGQRWPADEQTLSDYAARWKGEK